MSTRPPAAVVLAWKAERVASYAETAEHFGIPVGTIKSWTSRAKRGGVATAAPTQDADEPLDAFFRRVLLALEAQMATERGIAWVQLVKCAIDTREKLEATKPADEEHDPTFDERRASLQLWPVEWLEEAARELAERSRARFLLVTETHTAEMADAGWVTTENR